MAAPAATQASNDHMNGTGSAASLGLWDSVSIIVGIVVGVSIFGVPALIFGNVAGPWHALGAWLLGGILSLIGALCYAELATTYPKMGGDYVYLTRAFRAPTGFLFGWGRLSVIQTGSIGSLAYIFADYAVRLLRLSPGHTVWLACACVVGVTAINLLGIVVGKTAQNILTAAKVLGLLAIVVGGFYAFQFQGAEAFAVENPPGAAGFGFAMIFVLYAYGGWNDSAFVAAETRDRKRNIPRSLMLGIGIIAVLYLLVNLAYIMGMGFEGARKSWVPAADVLAPMLGERGGQAMSLLVVLSVLGAVNGVALTGARCHVALGRDHRLFALLGRWNPKKHAPTRALLVQATIAVLMIVGVGTDAGRQAIDTVLTGLRLSRSGLPWEQYDGGFGTLVSGTAPVFWLFFLMTGVSLIVLRLNDRDRPRPFTTPLFPVIPLIFCASCVYMLYRSAIYARGLSLFGFVPLALGIPLYFVSRHMRPANGAVQTTVERSEEQ